MELVPYAWWSNDQELSHRQIEALTAQAELKARWRLAPVMCLAHWTITQRTIHVILPNKTSDSSQKEP
ncbi:MAG TPA: hypothetical protein VGO57_09210, partial [Verrucomicrobiae bacterium]